MEEAKTFSKNLIKEHYKASVVIRRNIIKEYLQVLVLDFVYSHPKYNNLIFYGGSCLSHCYNLPRLSEDIDLVDLGDKINLDNLAVDLAKYFEEKTDLDLNTKVQKFRIYLKFPVLKELGLAGASESDLLLLKIEVFKEFNFCQKYKIETIPLFKANKSILIRTFDLPTLLATKIRAILYRKWEQKDKRGQAFIKVKGRDYFDLMWYLQKEIKPNLTCLPEFSNQDEMKSELLRIISKVDPKSIRLDLESLIEDKKFVMNLSKNIKDILLREIKEKL
ncbi:nucleotidyl transferase AbiEii/AbiGii toxin family protein [Patescibacteria group bacterium]|nr:nucleotidyl transferase AbiEii/AbiGii toxin family protein [Patescibacteria group bacterium]